MQCRSKKMCAYTNYMINVLIALELGAMLCTDVHAFKLFVLFRIMSDRPEIGI